MDYFCRATTRTILMCAALLFGAQVAKAADVKVLSVGALRSSLTAVIPDFEKTSGNKITMEAGAAGAMVARVEKGESVDVVIVTDTQIEKLVAQGKVISGTEVKVAKIGMGLCATKDVGATDISTMDAFKNTLIGAKSIGHTDPASGASSAIYAAKLLADLDVREQLKPKIKVFASNEKLFEAVGRGDVEFAFGQVTEIIAASPVVLVGPLPPSVQSYSIFGGGVAASAKDAEAAQAFLKFLTLPTTFAAMKVKGAELP